MTPEGAARELCRWRDPSFRDVANDRSTQLAFRRYRVWRSGGGYFSIPYVSSTIPFLKALTSFRSNRRSSPRRSMNGVPPPKKIGAIVMRTSSAL
jgi:hypothetical protein